MSKHKFEEVSALIDGEHSDGTQDAIDHLCKDEQFRNTWARYHLIRDCLKGHLPEHVSTQMGDRVRRALEEEPAILAPQRSVHRYLKPVAGFAIAALWLPWPYSVFNIVVHQLVVLIQGKLRQLKLRRRVLSNLPLPHVNWFGIHN